METALLIVGSVGFWIWLATKVNNTWLKQYMFLISVILTTGLGWIGWLSVNQSDLVALEWWRYSYLIVFMGWLLLWAGLWLTGALEKEEIENGF